MTMAFSPIQASQEITEKYKRYLKTIFQIADFDYERQFNQELDRSSMLAKGPYLDAVDSFSKGKSPAQLIEEGVFLLHFQNLEFRWRGRFISIRSLQSER